jgi:hypothetical protein
VRLARAKAGTSAIGGTLTDTGGHPEFPYSVTGTGVLQPCGHSDFTLSARADVTIPNGHSRFDLEVPAPGPGADWNKAIDSSGTSPVLAPTAAVLEYFDRIRFTLTTSGTNHPEIRAWYDEP